MRFVLAAAGVALLLVVVADVMITVLDLGRGKGLVTSRVSALLWQGVRVLRRRGASHRVIETLGVIIVVLVLSTWLVSVWVGWTLVYNAGTTAVMAGSEPATFWERAFFAGASLFSLTVGDLSPGPSAWRFVSALTALNGLVLVTLSISYLIPVLGGATERRSVAAYITTLGATPQKIVLRTCRGFGVEEVHDYLANLIPMLTDLAERHLAYPVLHYLHSADRRTAIAPSLAALDEALTIIEHGVEHDRRLPGSVPATRDAIEQFVKTLQMFSYDEVESPPAPSLKPLMDEGFATADEDQFSQEIERMEDHRRRLLAVVREDGWSWDEAVGDEASGAIGPNHVTER